MLFYYVGALLRRLELLPRLQRSDALMAAMFAAGVTLCVAYHLSNISHPLIIVTAYRMFIVVPLFVYFSKFMNHSKDRFTTLGLYSLELYVLHYFLIMGCSSYYAPWISKVSHMPFFFQLIINLFITSVIAILTMQLTKVANRNNIVKKIVLGKF